MIFDVFILLLSLALISFLSIFLVCIIVVRKLKEQCERVVSSSLESLVEKEQRYRKKYPKASDEEILDRVAHSECRTAGFIGFVTGLGGLVTLPITIPIDIITSVKSQQSLVEYILKSQNKSPRAIDSAKILAITFGTRKASQFGVKLTVSLAIRYAPQILLKAVPVIGGIIGFIINYLGTQSVVRHARRAAVKAMHHSRA